MPGFGQTARRLRSSHAATSYWIESGLFQGADLADNYSECGEAWAQLRQKDAAVADLRCSGEEGELYFVLAQLALSRGDIAAARRAFADVFREAGVAAGVAGAQVLQPARPGFDLPKARALSSRRGR